MFGSAKAGSIASGAGELILLLGFAIDTSTASGRFFFHVMASLTVEKTRAGLEVARSLGRFRGRKMTDSKLESARKLLAGGVPVKAVAKNLGVSVPTLYRWLPASS